MAAPASKRTILLIGGTGYGKSTVGNVLAGSDVFKEGEFATSETTHAQTHEVTIEGTLFKIVDTVGIGDTALSAEAVCMRIADACVECKDGINQVLFVTKGRFSAAEIAAFNLMCSVLLSPEVVKYTTIVRTNSPKFQDPKWREDCIRSFKACAPEARAITDNVPSILLIDNPGEACRSDWQTVRKASRQQLLMRLQACTHEFKPPSLQIIKGNVQGMVKEHKEREAAIEKNKQLLKENEDLQKANSNNSAILQQLVQGQTELQKAIVEQQKQNLALQQQLAEQQRQHIAAQSHDDGCSIL